MRIVFFGTPHFAVPTLRKLLGSTHVICGVVTQPDRPSGRGQRVAESPVKALAVQHGLPVIQPERLRDPAVADTLRAWRPDLGVVAAYGKLNRPGVNAAYASTWDIRRDFFPNSVAQVSYNWDCCGIAFSYRRLGLGALRSQNEFRFSFTIANVGTVGNIRESERLF